MVSSNYKKTIASVGSKKGFSVVVWLLIIATLLYFFKTIASYITKFFGGAKTDEQALAEVQQKQAIDYIKNKYAGIYSKTPRQRQYYISLANDLEQQMNKSKTDFKALYSTIKNLTDTELLAVYIEFGTRMNYEWTNEQGDLVDWVIMEDKMSPLDFFKRSDVIAIAQKMYRLSSIIPSAKKLLPYAY